MTDQDKSRRDEKKEPVFKTIPDEKFEKLAKKNIKKYVEGLRYLAGR